MGEKCGDYCHGLAFIGINYTIMFYSLRSKIIGGRNLLGCTNYIGKESIRL